MSMLGAQNNEQRSYLEMVEALKRHGVHATKDAQQLWRRIVFNIMISNTDDHLRNHGFLYANTQGWRLSPAFDLNPVPVEIKPRILTTNISLFDNDASLDLALSVANYFGLSEDGAKNIANEVATAVKDWRMQALRFNIKKTEIERMSSAFQHQDLEKALSF